LPSPRCFGQDFTVVWVHPVASARLAVAVMTFVPGRNGTVARKCPSGPATALTTAVVSPDAVGWPAEITTVLPAGAVPLTTIWPPAALAAAGPTLRRCAFAV
jgi:hypothetical protein